MCNFNIACAAREGHCDCEKPKAFSEIIKPIPIPFCVPNEASYLNTLFRIIIQQNEMIKNIADQTKAVLERLSNISDPTPSSVSLSSEEVTTSSQLQRIICGHDYDYQYSLNLISEMPNPAYKERSFSILLQIVDKNGEKVILPESVNFKVMLFTTESPPKVMKINTSGDKVLKGTVEAQGNSTIFFRKIAIKEVTSHFRNGCFFFVVTTKDTNVIKPLIVDNFVVKARKINNEGAPKKKARLESRSESPTLSEV
jgi:hypothetical protein